MTPPKYSATAISTPDSELVGCPEPALVVLVMMCRRIAFALACSSARETGFVLTVVSRLTTEVERLVGRRDLERRHAPIVARFGAAA